MDKHENEDDWEFDGEGGSVGDMLNIGDNFAVPTEEENDKGVEFYIFHANVQSFLWKNHLNAFREWDLKLETMLLLAHTTKSGEGFTRLMFIWLNLELLR